MTRRARPFQLAAIAAAALTLLSACGSSSSSGSSTTAAVTTSSATAGAAADAAASGSAASGSAAPSSAATSVSELVGTGTGGLVVYNAQHENLTQAWAEEFTKETGIAIEMRNGSDNELANQIVAEGSGSPADVFLTENSPGDEHRRAGRPVHPG